MTKPGGLPDWALREEAYEPVQDRDAYILKSTLRIMGALAKIRFHADRDDQGAECAAFKLFYTLLYILLIACAKNAAFTFLIIVGLLLRLCVMKGTVIKEILRVSLTAVLFSAFFLLPAVFFGSPGTFTVILTKTFASATLIALLAQTTRWNDLTSGFKWFFIPDLFIFTFDMTLKYIVLLGEICLDMLCALRLRSVGKNRRKDKALSGVLGAAFMKSKEMSEEMYGAMCCRGFSGEYHKPRKYDWRGADWLQLLPVPAALALFFYLEGVMK